MIGERPEPHLLRAVDWFDSQGIRRDIDRVYNFKHMLDGDAREWYADYFRPHGSIPTWKMLINDFSRYFSTQGRGEKNLHEAWRKMTFMLATDDIEVFIRDIQELAKQLNYTNQVLITTLRAAMPREIYGGRGERPQGRRSPGNSQSSYQPHRGRGQGGFRGKP